MEIKIRKFQQEDIPYKVKWINAAENNQFLHYDLPLREDKTLLWYNSIKDRTDRADFTIICNGEPAGLIGLLNIDNKNRKAEYYITLGGAEFKGRGIAARASDLLIQESQILVDSVQRSGQTLPALRARLQLPHEQYSCRHR